MRTPVPASLVFLFVAAGTARAGFDDPGVDRDGLPTMSGGFRVQVVAREPVVRNPAALAFDPRGRLFVGGGPQYRLPTKDTPGDTVSLLVDSDGDGVFDRARTFARGFNSIQALAWKGRDLWVANAPDLTVVRDLDGDDRADEYVLVFTGLGTLEHGLHGLTWAPDGRLYMTKGDTPVQPDAPAAFRRLQHMETVSSGSPVGRIFTRDTYRRTWVAPTDGHIEGGVLRMNAAGTRLEIVARGLRNPFDMAMDGGFHWLGTDNDSKSEGDRLFMPFFGAHFGHRHPWSNSWTGEDHPATAPVSGPTFDGSGVGTVFYDGPLFPARYRGTFFIGDWHRRMIYVYRPRWQGPLMLPDAPELEIIAQGGRTLFRPTDMETGPDGSLFVGGWGSLYGAKWQGNELVSEGRIFRIVHESAAASSPAQDLARWRRDPAARSLAELVADAGHFIPAVRVAAQDELVRRGPAVKGQLLAILEKHGLPEAQETWLAWAVGRLAAPDDAALEAQLARWASDGRRTNLRRQATRILAHRLREGGTRARALPAAVLAAVDSRDPRDRFEAVLALRQARQARELPRLRRRLAVESRGGDRLVAYALWSAIAELETPAQRLAALRDRRGAVRHGALLGLLERAELKGEQVRVLTRDPEPTVRALARDWLAKAGFGLDDPDAIVARLRALDNRNTNFLLRLDLLRALDTTAIEARHWEYLREAFYRPWRSKVQEVVPEEKGQEVAAALTVMARPAFASQTLPVLWDALDHPWPPVREGAVMAFGRLGAAAQAFLAARLPEAVGPSGGPRLHGAVAALAAGAPDAPAWTASAAAVAALARAFDTGDPLQRRNALALLAAAAPASWSSEGSRALARGVGVRAAADPDPRVHRGVPALARALGVDLPITAAERAPVTAAQVLPLLARADPARGRAVFNDASTANCAACHRAGGTGKAIGPDLSDLGVRTDVAYVIQSILDPSATIIEGFQVTGLILQDGRQVEGLVHDETARSLRLIGADGKEQLIDKRRIRERVVSQVSLMPSGYEAILSAPEIADLVAFLMSQRRIGATVSAAPTPR